MAAVLAKVAVSFPGNAGLDFGNRFDDYAKREQQIIESTTHHGIAERIDDGSGLYKVSRRQTID